MTEKNKFRVWTGTEMEYNVMVGKFSAFYVNPSNYDNNTLEWFYKGNDYTTAELLKIYQNKEK